MPSAAPGRLSIDVNEQELINNVRPDGWINPTPRQRYHLVVIGAGTAGLVAAAGAAGLGARVALIERNRMGGDCLNFGCVPSKALLSVAHDIDRARKTIALAMNGSPGNVDFQKVMGEMRKKRAEISSHDSARRFTGMGVDVYFGAGRFINENQVDVGGQTLSFRRAVIATGGCALVPPIPGLADAQPLTNETVFEMQQLPRRLIVIGGGPIGCEIAQALARFGSSVTVIDMANQVLPREEPDAAALIAASLRNDGVELFLGAKISRVDRQATEIAVTVQLMDSSQRVIYGDAIFVAVGRLPNVVDMGLEDAKVKYDKAIGVEVNDRLQTTNRHIYAAGDVCSAFKFTHAADFQARIVVQNALFFGRKKVSQLQIPWCTYTSPEVAHLGISPEEAAKKGIALATFTKEFSGVDRAQLEGRSAGYARVYCRRGSDRILGATIVGESAGDLIGEVALAMRHRIGLSKIAATIHPYPTRSDVLRKLGDQYNRSRLTPTVAAIFKRWFAWTR